MNKRNLAQSRRFCSMVAMARKTSHSLSLPSPFCMHLSCLAALQVVPHQQRYKSWLCQHAMTSPFSSAAHAHKPSPTAAAKKVAAKAENTSRQVGDNTSAAAATPPLPRSGWEPFFRHVIPTGPQKETGPDAFLLYVGALAPLIRTTKIATFMTATLAPFLFEPLPDVSLFTNPLNNAYLCAIITLGNALTALGVIVASRTYVTKMILHPSSQKITLHTPMMLSGTQDLTVPVAYLQKIPPTQKRRFATHQLRPDVVERCRQELRWKGPTSFLIDPRGFTPQTEEEEKAYRFLQALGGPTPLSIQAPSSSQPHP